jgi:hypothetical protein
LDSPLRLPLSRLSSSLLLLLHWPLLPPHSLLQLPLPHSPLQLPLHSLYAPLQPQQQMPESVDRFWHPFPALESESMPAAQ